MMLSIIFGLTYSTNGISTENGVYPEFNYNPSGNHAEASNGFLVKFGNQLNTIEMPDSEDIKLYPNPNNGNFTLVGTVLGKENFQMQVFDLSGRLLIHKKLGLYEQQHLNYSTLLKEGVYLLKLKSEKSKIEKHFKLVVK